MLGSMYGQVASYPDAYEGITNASPAAYHAPQFKLTHYPLNASLQNDAIGAVGQGVHIPSPGGCPPLSHASSNRFTKIPCDEAQRVVSSVK